MAVATAFSTQMALITGNTGGAVQSLPSVTQVGGRKRSFVASIALAGQASGTVIGIARIPLGATITRIALLTDTSLSTATIALGNSNSAAKYYAASTLTATDTPTSVGKASALMTPITSGYDCVTGLASKSYEDVVLTTAVASLPGSGNLSIEVEYVMD